MHNHLNSCRYKCIIDQVKDLIFKLGCGTKYKGIMKGKCIPLLSMTHIHGGIYYP